jgi:hypothetical protein
LERAGLRLRPSPRGIGSSLVRPDWRAVGAMVKTAVGAATRVLPPPPPQLPPPLLPPLLPPPRSILELARGCAACPLCRRYCMRLACALIKLPVVCLW